ncbi:hypothetical protein C0J52_10148 [Blattella germanica]|nr:hypothetical protein C0J52_10148 [Blattella germanica]
MVCLSFATLSACLLIPHFTEALQILGCGVFPPKKGDIALVLYVTVLNTAKDPLHVVTKMMECCSIITSNDTDCKFMKAMGGDMGLVNPREKRNLTFVYGNLYLHDREGECLVVLWYRCVQSSSTSRKRQRIHFNTKISLSKVPPLLQGRGSHT